MLGMRKYTKKYIEGCRARIESDMAAYKKFSGSTGTAFESVFYNNMVIVLDHLFVHRLRTVEGKDGNAMNEVRILCNSIMENKNVMTVEKAIKYEPAESVLKYKSGDQIRLTEASFLLLYKAYFAGIESKYS